jgi:hypothetical protein
MVPFMKDKPRDTFFKTPDMPSELKALNEQRKRDELEKLEKADAEGRRLGVVYNQQGPRRGKTGDYNAPNRNDSSNQNIIVNPNTTNNTVTDDPPPPSVNPKKGGDDTPKTPVKPAETPKKVDPPKEEKKPEGTKKKGKKGDDDP